MKLTIISADETINSINANILETGSSRCRKKGQTQRFVTPLRVVLILCWRKTIGIIGNRCRKGKGFGTRNKAGEGIADFADTRDLVLVITWFIEWLPHLPIQ